MKIVKWIISIVLGGLFLFSGYSKLIELDAFEVFLYRSSFLDFDFSSLLARFIIGMEWLIGIGLISRLKFKTSWFLAAITTLFFSVFLSFQLAAGNNENCFCFGELMDFSPLESLFKNAVIILLLLIIRPLNSLQFRFNVPIYGMVLTASLTVPYIISPPDMFVQGRLSTAEHDQNELTVQCFCY